MKTMKAILSGKGLRKGEKGFTLVELLIVLAIIAVLAAVVIPNVTGMLGKGQEQSYSTDKKTVQSGVMAYDIDIRDGGVAVDAGHYLPVEGVVAEPYPGVKVTELANLTDVRLDPTAANDDPDIAGNHRVEVDPGCTGTFAVATGIIAGSDIYEAAINMDWVAEKMQDPANPPTWSDPGPYLNEVPESAHVYNVSGNNNTDPGSYLWVCNKSGEVFGIYSKEIGATYYWFSGFQGTYP